MGIEGITVIALDATFMVKNTQIIWHLKDTDKDSHFHFYINNVLNTLHVARLTPWRLGGFGDFHKETAVFYTKQQFAIPDFADKLLFV